MLPPREIAFATVSIMARNHLSLTGVLFGSALFALSACSAGSDDEDTSAPEPTMTPAETTSAAPDVTEVDPTTFEMDGRYVFDVPMGDDTTTLCIMGDSTVTCTGKPPEDAPDVEIPPFPMQRPGAVSLDDEGLTWTMVEGVPPAPGTLEPSQRISDGDVTAARCRARQTRFRSVSRHRPSDPPAGLPG